MSYQLTDADHVWNRACSRNWGKAGARSGDLALADLLIADGYVMNGGVLYGVELLTDSEFENALNGFRYFGIDLVIPALEEAKQLLGGPEEADLGVHEPRLNDEYENGGGTSRNITQQFERRYHSHSEEFAPLTESDRQFSENWMKP